MIFRINALLTDLMAFTGSKILVVNQNRTTPMLDLLVRESIQNSLDAAREKVDHISIDFITNKFKSSKLLSEFEGIESGVKSIITDDECDFLAIRDSNCIGLTGELNPYTSKAQSRSGQNLYNLVYDVMNAQEKQGAGGSWGIGKTIYYRLGIGIVIFYSRIKLESGKYEERLVAALIENENNKKLIYKTDNYRGIAFFGEPIDSNKTIPITDIESIEKILEIFNISRYRDNQTGTTVIVPYINKDKLMSDKREKLEHYPYWEENIESKLSTLIQRWYFPRLDNRLFKGPYLKAKINGEEITKKNMEPLYIELQELYKMTLTNDEVFKEYLIKKDINIGGFREKIGTFVCYKFNRDDLKMNPPYNLPSPYSYINKKWDDEIENLPIVMYTRKPGMVISYEVGERPWVDPKVKTSNDEFIIGLFNLNSDSSDKDGNLIEEYFRNSEKSDHFSWSDTNKKYFNNLTLKIRKELKDNYLPKTEDSDYKVSKSLGQYLGKLLLPPEDFGDQATPKAKKETVDTGKRPGLNYTITLQNQTAETIDFMINIKTKRKLDIVKVSWLIATVQKSYSRKDWDGMNLTFPIELHQIAFTINKINNNEYQEKDSWSRFINRGIKFEVANLFDVKTNETKTGIFGLEIRSLQEMTYDIDLMLRFKIIDYTISAAFEIKGEEFKIEKDES